MPVPNDLPSRATRDPALHFARMRILTRSFDRMWHFYADTLGLARGMGDASGPYAEFLEGDRSWLALFDAERMAEALGAPYSEPGNRLPGAHVVVLQTDDVDEAYQRLRHRGVRFLKPPTDQPLWRIRVAHLLDPDGNVVELYTDFPTDRTE